MKKILLLLSIIFITNTANAKIEHYASVKMGLGRTTIYVDGNDTFGDYFVKVYEQEMGINGLTYESSGMLWELSPALGIDWTAGNTYGAPSSYDWFHLRLEGELGYNHYSENGKFKYNYMVMEKSALNINQIFLLANGYADFRIDKFVPYVGLGFGYSFGKEEATLTANGEEVNDSTNDNGIIYALHLGVGYKYSDITTIDFGCRRVYMPTQDDGQYIFDTIRLGTRFRI